MNSVLPLRSGARRMRVLMALSSATLREPDSCRLVFETCSRLTDRFAFELALDDHDARVVGLVAEFGETHQMPVHVGPARPLASMSDIANENLPRLLKTGRWDLVETAGWSNGANNGDIIANIGSRPLCFTPRYQPALSNGRTSRRVGSVGEVLAKLVRRADVVFCGSPWARTTLQRTFAPDQDNCVFIPEGCDLDVYRPLSQERAPQLVSVVSGGEARPQVQRVLDLHERLARHHPGLRVVLVGDACSEALASSSSRRKSRVEVRDGLDEAGLASLLAESLALVHLSKEETPGLLILKALACGTPSLVGRTASSTSLFRGSRGTYFCSVDDPSEVEEAAHRILRQHPLAVERAVSDRPRLEEEFSWDRIAEARAIQLRAAWFRRKYWAISA